MNIIIRKATLSDTEGLKELVHQLAIYEKKNPAEIKITAEKIESHGFNSHPYFQVLVAEANQELLGFALYFFTYAGSKGAPILYLEDLFVLQNHRRKKIGTELLSALAKIAKKENCCRMEWHVFKWNDAAITFYQSLGATLKTDFVQFSLEDHALQDLAEKAHES